MFVMKKCLFVRKVRGRLVRDLLSEGVVFPTQDLPDGFAWKFCEGTIVIHLGFVKAKCPQFFSWIDFDGNIVRFTLQLLHVFSVRTPLFQ